MGQAPTRATQALKWAGRQRRIFGRIVNHKSVPRFTYRWDGRAPATIRQTGFDPRHALSNVSVVEHVNNSYSAGPNAGQQTKYDSHWVSTGAYGMLKRLDPTMAQGILTRWVYKIDTAIAAQTGPFRDANDTFDKAGIDRPYASQREWVKEGGIPQNAVIECMDGATFAASYDFALNVGPDEDALQGWQVF